MSNTVCSEKMPLGSWFERRIFMINNDQHIQLHRLDIKNLKNNYNNFFFWVILSLKMTPMELAKESQESSANNMVRLSIKSYIGRVNFMIH